MKREHANFDEKIKEKEKEKDLADQKYSELKKLVRARTVKPLENISQSQISQSPDFIKKSSNTPSQ